MLPKLEHSNDPFPKAQKLKESKKKDKVTKFIEILFEIFEVNSISSLTEVFLGSSTSRDVQLVCRWIRNLDKQPS